VGTQGRRSFQRVRRGADLPSGMVPLGRSSGHRHRGHARNAAREAVMVQMRGTKGAHSARGLGGPPLDCAERPRGAALCGAVARGEASARGMMEASRTRGGSYCAHKVQAGSLAGTCLQARAGK